MVLLWLRLSGLIPGKSQIMTTGEIVAWAHLDLSREQVDHMSARWPQKEGSEEVLRI